MNEALATLGHNNPPDDAEIIMDGLRTKYAEAESRFCELVASANRAPADCRDDITAAKISDLVKLLNSHRKHLDNARAAEKEPYRKKADAVHSWFIMRIDGIDAMVAKLKKPLGTYLQAKADEERRKAREEQERAEAEAKRLAEEAQRLEQAKMPELANAAIDQAIRAETTAQAAAVTQAAKPADLASVRGSYGSRGGLSTRWVGVIVDRDQLDLNSLRPYFSNEDLQKAINGFVKANCKGQTGATLRGADIKEQTSAVVR